MLVKTAHKNFSIKKVNEKHLQRGECCAAHSTIDDINLISVNTFDLKLDIPSHQSSDMLQQSLSITTC